MGVSLSIKCVPEALAERLRQRAVRNHRSLQRELMAIVEAAVEPSAASAPAVAAETEGRYAVTAGGPTPAGTGDDLLNELDGIVAGSPWGAARLLTRDQVHDRALAREFDFDAREAELGAARRQAGTR